MVKRGRIGAVAVAAGLISLGLGAPAKAANIGVGCTVASLVGAITTADTSAGPDKLDLADGCTYTLTAAHNDANGLPKVTTPITVNGNGATIGRDAGAPPFRIFEVTSAGDLTLNDLTVRGGFAPDCPTFSGEICGGGIANYGRLLVTRSRIADNIARGAAANHNGFASGGGIENHGTATVDNSEVSGNVAFNTADNLTDLTLSDGGGITNEEGTLTVRNSRVTGNLSTCLGRCRANGGGIANYNALIVTGSEVTNNEATCEDSCGAGGGGLGAPFGGETTVTKSKINGNSASCTTPGCGASSGGISSRFGLMTVVGSEVSANAVTGGHAGSGGIGNDDGTLTVRNSRVNNNTVTATTGNAVGGGIDSFFGGDSELSSSEVVGNSVSCAASGCEAQGGGIHNVGPLAITNTRVRDNTASAPQGTARGGGLYDPGSGGELTLKNATVTGNTATGATAAGGGIASFGGTVDVTKSEVANNTALCSGGGCLAQGGGVLIDDDATVTLTRSAVTGNKAAGAIAEGGGVYLGTGTLNLTSTTITGNIPDDCEPDIGSCT